MIHIIDNIEYTENPLLDVSVAHALAEGEEVTVINDDGEVVYEGNSAEYAYKLLEIIGNSSIKYKLENPTSNVIFLDDYR